MEFTSLEPWKLTALMLAGGVFSLAGLWLIFKPKADGQSMVVQVAGMKFEASSAGVLVFLIGTAFFATPLFVQERASASQTGSVRPDNGNQNAAGSDEANPEKAGKATVGLSEPDTITPLLERARAITLEGGEIEPNQTLASANTIGLGAAITGEVASDNEDYFIVEMPEGQTGELIVTATAEWIGLTIFSDVGEVLHSDQVSISDTWRGRIEEAPLYGIRLQQWNGRDPMPYQLMAVARPE